MDYRIIIFLLLSIASSYSETRIFKRSVSNSLGDVLGTKGSGNNKRNKAPVKITPPLRLKPGETAEQAPGWQHCIKNMRATLSWKSFKSPGYPDFLESQIQCSWIIEAPIGMRVKLAFRDLDMIGVTGSCAKQFAQIIDITTGKSQGRFCGNSRPGDYVTLGTKARVDLQADKAIAKVRGFLISFTAVKEIPGFRSTKIFPSMGGRTGDSSGGKINLNNFMSSNANSGGPKNTPGNKRANKRLVYESDINPLSTDPSGTTTEEAPANTVGSEDDFGWIGNDEDIQDQPLRPRAPNGQSLRVRPSANRPRTPRPAPDGSIIITQSTLPVRIRAKKPTTEPPEVIEPESEGPIIYGIGHQPYDPDAYTTVHPVRLDRNKYVDHRPEVLTTTNLIIIIACAAMFVVVIIAVALFVWFWRRRRNKRRKKKKEMEQRKKEEQQQRNDLEMKVMDLGGDGGDLKSKEMEIQRHERSRELPRPPMLPSDSPPRYPRQVYPYPRDGNMEQQNYGNIMGKTRLGVNTISRHDLPPRDYPRSDDRGRREYPPPRDVRSHPPIERYPGHPADVRHHTIDPRRHPPRTSQFRHHTLDVRNLERDHHPMDKRHVDFRGEQPHRYSPRDSPRRYPPNGEFPRDKPRRSPYPNGITGVDDVDEDYCSGASDDSGSGKARMRREYSPWEVEQQKKDRRNKLINGKL